MSVVEGAVSTVVTGNVGVELVSANVVAVDDVLEGATVVEVSSRVVGAADDDVEAARADEVVDVAVELLAPDDPLAVVRIDDAVESESDEQPMVKTARALQAITARTRGPVYRHT